MRLPGLFLDAWPSSPPFCPIRNSLTRLCYRGIARFRQALIERGVTPERPAPAVHSRFDSPFFTPQKHRLDLMHRDEVLERARQVMDGHITLWGHHRISLGSAPSWHKDPITGHAWPKTMPASLWRAWESRPPQGAVRRVWELNRQSWLFDLGMAYQLTDLNEFKDAGWRHIRHWIGENPPEYGINWISPLEMAVRSVAWLWFFRMTGMEDTPPDAKAGVISSLHAMGTRTAWSLSVSSAPNNHLAGEALLLLSLGSLLPDLPGAPRWAHLGRNLLVDSVTSHIGPSGSPGEQSPSYLLFVLEVYLLAQRILLDFSPLTPFPPSVQKRLASGLAFLWELYRTLSYLPQVGDCDDAALLPWDLDPVLRLSGLIQAGHALLDVDLPMPEHANRTGWRLAGPHRPLPDPTGNAHTTANHAADRDGWIMGSREKPGIGMLFLASPLGLPPKYGHGHADALSVICTVRGTPLLCDSGTFSYEEEPWRSYFRGTSAHSTVMVEELDQADPVDTFTWAFPYEISGGITSRIDGLIASAIHTGYQRLPQRVTHRRNVLLSTARLQVEDMLEGAFAFTAQLLWHIHPSWTIHVDSERTAHLTMGGMEIRLVIEGSGTLRLVSAARRPILGWHSSRFEQLDKTSVLAMEACGTKLRWVSVFSIGPSV